MKKRLRVSVAIGLFLTPMLAIQAQDVTPTAMVKVIDDDFLLGGYFNKVSDNGRYGVGMSEIQETAFLFDFETETYVLLTAHDNPDGDGYYMCEALDVSNDGTVVGSFGVQSKKYGMVLVPGIWKEGVWKALPLHFSAQNGMDGKAASISPDGSVIGGYTMYEMGKYGPTKWINEELQPMLDLKSISPFSGELEIPGQGGIVRDMSADGKILVGTIEFHEGARSAAIFDETSFTRITDPNWSVDTDQFMCDGYAERISPNGKYVAAYHLAGDGVLRHGIWTKETGFVENSCPGIISFVANDGTFFYSNAPYGSPNIETTDGTRSSLMSWLESRATVTSSLADGTLATVMAASDDMRVIVGAAICVTDMGALNRPYYVKLNDMANSLNESMANEIRVYPNPATDYLEISGTFDYVELYNQVGARLVSQESNRIELKNYQPGIYMVKIHAQGQNCYKKVVKE